MAVANNYLTQVPTPPLSAISPTSSSILPDVARLREVTPEIDSRSRSVTPEIPDSESTATTSTSGFRRAGTFASLSANQPVPPEPKKDVTPHVPIQSFSRAHTGIPSRGLGGRQGTMANNSGIQTQFSSAHSKRNGSVSTPATAMQPTPPFSRKHTAAPQLTPITPPADADTHMTSPKGPKPIPDKFFEDDLPPTTVVTPWEDLPNGLRLMRRAVRHGVKVIDFAFEGEKREGVVEDWAWKAGYDCVGLEHLNKKAPRFGWGFAPVRKPAAPVDGQKAVVANPAALQPPPPPPPAKNTTGLAETSNTGLGGEGLIDYMMGPPFKPEVLAQKLRGVKRERSAASAEPAPEDCSPSKLLKRSNSGTPDDEWDMMVIEPTS